MSGKAPSGRQVSWWWLSGHERGRVVVVGHDRGGPSAEVAVAQPAQGTDRPTGGRGLVLVVEDDPAIADLIGRYLRRDGFGVHVERDGPGGLGPAAIVLDVGRPGLDGVEVCRRLRAAGDQVPVLFVTARDDEVDRVLGLELGADDYVTKPFSPRELAARVRAVLRRAGRATAVAAADLALGPVVLRTGSRRVLVEGREVALTATEFDLLAHLLAVPDRVFTREQLLSAVWGYAASAGTRTVDVHIAQLRAKLGPRAPIRTVRGVGYAAGTP
jgi:DNA-binding response OmpR family regulator